MLTMICKCRCAIAMLWVSALPGMLQAEEPAARPTSIVATAAELTLGASCRIWTKREGKISICYEGTVKAVDKQQITIVAKRAHVTRWLAFDWQLCEICDLTNQEIEIATGRIDRIRLLQGPISKKVNEP